MIDTEIAVALIASGGGVLGAFAGVIASAKLMTYRMGQLEKKVEKHNTVIERTYKLEENAGCHAGTNPSGESSYPGFGGGKSLKEKLAKTD